MHTTGNRRPIGGDKDGLHDADFQMSRDIIRALVKRVEIEPSNIKITDEKNRQLAPDVFKKNGIYVPAHAMRWEEWKKTVLW